MTSPDLHLDEVRALVLGVFAAASIIEGRFCHVCGSDLPEGVEDRYPPAGNLTLPGRPLGGHRPGCVAALLLRWAQRGEDDYTRERADERTPPLPRACRVTGTEQHAGLGCCPEGV